MGKGGGVALQAYQLFTDLRRQIDVNIVCLDAPGPHQSLAHEPGITVAGPLVFPRGIVTMSRALRALRHEYDIFQVWDPFYALPAAYLARVFPRIISFGMDPGFDVAKMYGEAARTVVRGTLPLMLADGVVVTNSKFLAERLRIDPPRVIPNGLDVDRFERVPPKEEARKRLGLPEDGTLLACLGKVIRPKRIEWALDVVRRLPKTSVVIIGGYTEEHYGDTYYRELLARYRDVRDRVIFAGEVHWETVPTYLAAADVFVHPSEFEGLPNAVLEAMAAGLPPIVSDIPPHREIVENGVNGFIVDDSESMTRMVQTLATDDRLRRTVGASARSFVRSRFSLDAIAQAYLNLYRSVLNT